MINRKSWLDKFLKNLAILSLLNLLFIVFFTKYFENISHSFLIFAVAINTLAAIILTELEKSFVFTKKTSGNF